MNSRTYTDFEQLAQAYVDGELVGDDRLEFEAYLAEDSSRWQYVREIEILKNQVRGAFPTTDTAPVRVQPERRYRLVAAALVVAHDDDHVRPLGLRGRRQSAQDKGSE